MRKPIVIVAVAALALVGCGGEDEPKAPVAEPSRLQSQESVHDLRAAVESAGYDCDEWRVIPQPINAVERATCTNDVVLSIHTDASQVQHSVEELAPMMSAIGATSVHLTGPNWSINCSDDVRLCELFQGELAGEVQIFEKEG